MQDRSFSYESMGSHWSVSTPLPLDPLAWETVAREIRMASTDFDAAYSRFKRDSLIWSLADATGIFEVPEDLTVMLQWYLTLYDASGRKLNPLIGHAISDLGYDDTYSLTPQKTIRSTPDLVESIRIIDPTHIELRRPALIDLGALGKGYFVDRIAQMLESRGITQYLVNGSGDIRYRGERPLAVGMEDPDDPSIVLGSLQIPEGSVCASGTNRRRWGADLHHVIDPHTSYSTRGIVATWVYAPTATAADALASCLFFARPEILRTQHRHEYCVLYDDRTAVTSPNFPGELYV